MADQTNNIPKGWKITTLGEVAEINPSESLKIGTLAKYVGMESINPFNRKISKFEIKKFSGGMKFRNGDTLLARITPCLENGKTAFVDILGSNEIGFGSTEYIVIREIENKSDKKFLYYLSISPKFRELAIKLMTGTSGRQRVQTDQLVNEQLLVPNYPEQRAIAAVLSAFDDKIELLREQNKTLEATAQAIFKEWFVRFNFPDKDGRPYKASGGKMIDSELGEIPEGWRVGKLGELIEIFDSKRIPLSSDLRARRKGKYPYYGATSIVDYIDDYLFDGTYLLLAEDGSVMDEKGHPMLQYVWGKFWVSNHAHVIQGKNLFSTEMIMTFLKNTNISRIVNGAVQLKISQANLLSFPILIASKELLVFFDSLIQPLFKKIKHNTTQIQTLSKLRDTLLPKLMKGEVRVKGFEN